MKKIRFGVIGAGGIADRRTIPGILLAANATLTAVMEPDPEYAEALRAKHNALYAFNTLEDILSCDEVDAVYIATPVSLHATQAKAAADHGKHILLEKPIAMTAEEAEEVVSYCEGKGVKIAAGFMMRFGSHIMTMKRMISEGKIGQVVSGYSQFTLWFPDGSGNWRQDKEKSGGGCLMDMGVHCIDLMEYITGSKVTTVAALNDTIAFKYNVEDTSSLLLGLENGAHCVVQTNFNIPDEAAKWRLEVFGTKGRLMGDTVIGQNDGGKLNAVCLEQNYAYNSTQDHNDDEGIDIEGNFGNMYTREIESFCNSLLNGEALEVPASDAVHVQRIIEAAYKSSRDKIIITL